MPKVEPGDKYLGSLCSRGHDHYGDGRSLRYSSSRTCVKCCKKAIDIWKKENPERLKLLQANYKMLQDRPGLKKYMRHYYFHVTKAKRRKEKEMEMRRDLT